MGTLPSTRGAQHRFAPLRIPLYSVPGRTHFLASHRKLCSQCQSSAAAQRRALLNKLSGNSRLVCRQPPSYAYLARHRLPILSEPKGPATQLRGVLSESCHSPSVPKHRTRKLLVTALQTPSLISKRPSRPTWIRMARRHFLSMGAFKKASAICPAYLIG